MGTMRCRILVLAEPTYRRTGHTHTDMWYALGSGESSEGDCATQGLVANGICWQLCWCCAWLDRYCQTSIRWQTIRWPG